MFAYTMQIITSSHHRTPRLIVNNKRADANNTSLKKTQKAYKHTRKTIFRKELILPPEIIGHKGQLVYLVLARTENSYSFVNFFQGLPRVNGKPKKFKSYQSAFNAISKGAAKRRMLEYDRIFPYNFHVVALYQGRWVFSFMNNQFLKNT